MASIEYYVKGVPLRMSIKGLRRPVSAPIMGRMEDLRYVRDFRY